MKSGMPDWKELRKKFSLDELRTAVEQIKKLEKGSAPVRSINSPRVSELDEIRAKLKTEKNAIARVQLARRAREIRGTMLEVVSVLPDEKTARAHALAEKDPRTRTILMRYANALRRR